MAKKIHVLVKVDPKTGTTIKPFAAKLAKPSKAGTDKEGITGSATVTYNNGSVDGDGTID